MNMPQTGGPSGAGAHSSGLTRIADRLESVVDGVGRAVAWVCLAMVLVVAVNVILRYLFHVGPVSMQEMEWHLMSPIALVGMSYAMRHGDHVRVDIFYDKMSPRARRWVDFIAATLTLIIAVVVFELALWFVKESFDIGEVSPDPGGLKYRWLLKSIIPFGFFLLGVQALAQMLRTGALILRGDHGQ